MLGRLEVERGDCGPPASQEKSRRTPRRSKQRCEHQMDIAKGIGQSGRVAEYEVADTELAVGCTLGGPKAQAIIKANGAIEKAYSIDSGETLFGTVILRHFDAKTGM